MNIKFVTNDYLLAWNILFIKSLTNQMDIVTKKILNVYKDECREVFNDKNIIINDYKNFIPNNDVVYNALIEKDDFEILKKSAERYRLVTMKLWDKNIKKINNLTKNILRKKLSSYLCFVLNKDFGITDIINNYPKDNVIIIGKNYSDDNDFLIDLLYKIVKEEINVKEKDILGIKDVILEMAILNEFATSLKGRSCYDIGNKNLVYLKRQIYPYWLMYLGIPKEGMLEYMKRDKIVFDINKFVYEKELINMNIEEFIEFIIRNQRYIVKINRLADTEEIL